MPSALAARAGIGQLQEDILRSVSDLLAAAMDQPCDLALLFPPFGSPDRPSLGLHVIAQIAQSAGLRCKVVYTNLSFARLVGLDQYRALCHTPTEYLVGERLFAKAGPGSLPATGSTPECWGQIDAEVGDFADMQCLAALWVDSLARGLANLNLPLLGATTVFEQTRAALALLHHTKALNPATRTLLGGANTEGAMGRALATMAPNVDHIFSGESEQTFADFLQAWRSGTPIDKVIGGSPLTDMNSLAPPNYDDYFVQLKAVLGKSPDNGFEGMQLRLPYESSRGCWWGEKQHCTFCGLNAEGMTHRTKDPIKVEVEIQQMAERHKVSRILMVDNIMPHAYFSTLLPKLTAAEQRLSIFYEQKSNLSLSKMRLLKEAGVDDIQPGIESLSSALLARMRKGAKARTGLNCLRYARATGIQVAWNLLCDFPGDGAEDYEGMIALIPLLGHLQPPGGVSGLSIDRFSPYFDAADAFGITNITPLPAYAEVFPPAQAGEVAYHFAGQYSSAIRSQGTLHKDLSDLVDHWGARWSKGPAPLLSLFDLSEDRILLIDERGLGHDEARLVTIDQAKLLLNGCPADTPEGFEALDQGLLAVVDGHWLPLAIADAASPIWS